MEMITPKLELEELQSKLAPPKQLHNEWSELAEELTKKNGDKKKAKKGKKLIKENLKEQENLEILPFINSFQTITYKSNS